MQRFELLPGAYIEIDPTRVHLLGLVLAHIRRPADSDPSSPAPLSTLVAFPATYDGYAASDMTGANRTPVLHSAIRQTMADALATVPGATPDAFSIPTDTDDNKDGNQ